MTIDHQEAKVSILAPISASYFWDKRCLLLFTKFLHIADDKVETLTFEEKVQLLETIKRARVVHAVIFRL